MKKNLLIAFFFPILFLSCSRSPGEVWQERITEHEASCLTKYPADSADYKPLKCGFYRGKDGDLYMKKVQADKFSPPYCYSVFFDKFYQKQFEDSSVQVPLSAIVDLPSLVCFDSSSYSKDKNRCYYYFDTSDGGFMQIIHTANAQTFRPLPYPWWARDNAFVYYRGRVVKGLNIKTFEILHLPVFPKYLRDDKQVFFECDPIPGADPRSFRLQPDSLNFDAEDKNHKYQYGEIVK